MTFIIIIIIYIGFFLDELEFEAIIALIATLIGVDCALIGIFLISFYFYFILFYSFHILSYSIIIINIFFFFFSCLEIFNEKKSC